LSHALAQDFVQVARAKGLPERTVIMRHALRDALNPLITLFGYAFGSVVSGSVIVETVLGWPGLGALSVNAVRYRDVPLLMGVVMITATAVLAGNLLADILLRLNDPRLRPRHAPAQTRQSGRRSLYLPAPGA
jgi:peptide/nickel transport system permease protein